MTYSIQAGTASVVVNRVGQTGKSWDTFNPFGAPLARYPRSTARPLAAARVWYRFSTCAPCTGGKRCHTQLYGENPRGWRGNQPFAMQRNDPQGVRRVRVRRLTDTLSKRDLALSSHSIVSQKHRFVRSTRTWGVMAVWTSGRTAEG